MRNNPTDNAWPLFARPVPFYWPARFEHPVTGQQSSLLGSVQSEAPLAVSTWSRFLKETACYFSDSSALNLQRSALIKPDPLFLKLCQDSQRHNQIEPLTRFWQFHVSDLASAVSCILSLKACLHELGVNAFRLMNLTLLYSSPQILQTHSTWLSYQIMSHSLYAHCWQFDLSADANSSQINHDCSIDPQPSNLFQWSLKADSLIWTIRQNQADAVKALIDLHDDNGLFKDRDFVQTSSFEFKLLPDTRQPHELASLAIHPTLIFEQTHWKTMEIRDASDRALYPGHPLLAQCAMLLRKVTPQALKAVQSKN